MIWRQSVIGLALLGLGMAACSTADSNPSAITRSTSSTAPTSSTNPAKTAVGPMCRNRQLAVSIQSSYVGAGSAAEELGFRNIGKSLCTLRGYPGVAALNTQGQQIAQAERSESDGALQTAVGLKPGQIAAALVQGGDGSAVKCDYFTRSFLVTPPNLTRATKVTADSSSAAIGVSDACPISIDPVTPETTQPIPAG
jgi:hypothetical protein